jgi:TonB family protein
MEAEPLPEYPKGAIDKHIEGTVIIHLVASVDGAVKQTEATSGPPELTKSALDAVKQWRFAKTLLNGQPVEIDTTISLVYALRPAPVVTVEKDYKPTGISSRYPSWMMDGTFRRELVNSRCYDESNYKKWRRYSCLICTYS